MPKLSLSSNAPATMATGDFSLSHSHTSPYAQQAFSVRELVDLNLENEWEATPDTSRQRIPPSTTRWNSRRTLDKRGKHLHLTPPTQNWTNSGTGHSYHGQHGAAEPLAYKHGRHEQSPYLDCNQNGKSIHQLHFGDAATTHAAPIQFAFNNYHQGSSSTAHLPLTQLQHNSSTLFSAPQPQSLNHREEVSRTNHEYSRHTRPLIGNFQYFPAPNNTSVQPAFYQIGSYCQPNHPQQQPNNRPPTARQNAQQTRSYNTLPAARFFTFKSDERAEKRKEYNMKLEEKLLAKEAKMSEMQAKSQYTFGLNSCFHEDIDFLIARIGIGFGVQILCSYVTFRNGTRLPRRGTRLGNQLANILAVAQ